MNIYKECVVCHKRLNSKNTGIRYTITPTSDASALCKQCLKDSHSRQEAAKATFYKNLK